MNLIRRIAFRLKPITDARHREFFMQRLVKDVPARERRADATASRLPPIPGEGRARAASGAHALKQQGFVAIPDLIKTEWLPAMRSYFSEHACSDPYRPERGTFRAEVAPAGTHVAYFSHDVVARAPHAFEIANDAGVLGIVAEMLGAKPTISYMMAWWSLPAGEAAQHAEKFHRDLDDWRFAKLFCYLTDVDEGSGPHVFVRGSHAVNKLTRLRRFSDEEVEIRLRSGQRPPLYRARGDLLPGEHLRHASRHSAHAGAAVDVSGVVLASPEHLRSGGSADQGGDARHPSTSGCLRESNLFVLMLQT